MIRDCTIEDASRIAEIYNHYVENTIISFEEEPVTSECMAHRISDIIKTYPWIVYEEKGVIIGYAYAMPWKTRSAYRHSVECSIYLDVTRTGKGIGTLLYKALIQRLKKLPIHCIIGGIALPNDASVALVEKFGFKKVAHFKDVGLKFSKWIDVAYWQLIIEK